MNVAPGLAILSLATIAASRFFDSWNRKVYERNVGEGEDAEPELAKNRRRKSTFDWSLLGVLALSALVALYSAFADTDDRGMVARLNARIAAQESALQNLVGETSDLKARVAQLVIASERSNNAIRKELEPPETKRAQRSRSSRKERR